MVVCLEREPGTPRTLLEKPSHIILFDLECVDHPPRGADQRCGHYLGEKLGTEFRKRISRIIKKLSHFNSFRFVELKRDELK